MALALSQVLMNTRQSERRPKKAFGFFGQEGLGKGLGLRQVIPGGLSVGRLAEQT